MKTTLLGVLNAYDFKIRIVDVHQIVFDKLIKKTVILIHRKIFKAFYDLYITQR
jgi:hypothetical protein